MEQVICDKTITKRYSFYYYVKNNSSDRASEL